MVRAYRIKITYIESLETEGNKVCQVLQYMWIRSGDRFILAYSTSSRSPFSHITKYYNDAKRTKESCNPFAQADSTKFDPALLSLVLIGNNNNLKKREVSVEDGLQLAKELGCELFETSTEGGNWHK
jgi:GTPase KRas